MPNLAPVVKQTYTDEERAVIAGYLLRQRAGTLQALSSTERWMEITTDIGPQRGVKYYSNCESYSRFLLYWIGYTVNRKEMYAGE